MTTLKYHRGTISLLYSWNELLLMFSTEIERIINLIPQIALDQRMKRDQGSYHMTVLTAAECDLLKSTSINVKNLCTNSQIYDAIPIGVSHVSKSDNECWYLTMYCCEAQKLRLDLGLNYKYFHITLGFISYDFYGSTDLYRDIINWNDIKVLQHAVISICENSANDIIQLESEKYLVWQFTDMFILSNGFDLSRENFLILKTIVLWSKKINCVSLCEELGYFIFSKGYIFGLKVIVSIHLYDKNSDNNEVITNSDYIISLIDKVIPLHIISIPQNETMMIKRINRLLQRYDKSKVLGLDKETNILDWHLLPRNFSFIPIRLYANISMISLPHFGEVDYLVSACAYPSNKSQLMALSCSGIKHIITMHESPFSQDLVETGALQKLNLHYFYLLDSHPPSIEQLQQIIGIIQSAVESNEGIVIHCEEGNGITNTVLIGYFMKILQLPLHDSMNAITLVRTIVLSQSQQLFLKEWERLSI
eukprot:gene7922-10752_t